MAIKSYDFIFGKKLSNYHTQSVYKDRVAIEELKSDIAILNLIKDEVLNMKKQVKLDLSDDVSIALTELMGVINKVANQDDSDPEMSFKLRELFIVLQYLGYNMFLFERQDLNTDLVQPDMIEAYLYDNNDDMISDIGVIAKAWGVVFDEPAMASLPDTVMSFVGKVINFSGFTMDMIKLRSEIESYKALAETSGGYLYNVEPILQFTENYGYRYQIVL